MFYAVFIDRGRLSSPLNPPFRVCSQSTSNGRANDCLTRSLTLRRDGAIAVAESVGSGRAMVPMQWLLDRAWVELIIAKPQRSI